MKPTQLKTSLHRDSIFYALITTTTTCLVYITTQWLGPTLFVNSFGFTALSILLSVFLTFFFHGTTKKIQLTHAWCYSALTALILSFAVFLTLVPEPYFSLLRTLLLLICFSLGRFASGGRFGGLFMIVYFIAFFMLFTRNDVAQNLYDTLYVVITSVILTVSAYTVIYLLLFPVINGYPAGKVENNFLIKIAIRLTLSMNIAFLISDMIGLHHASWVCFSILVTQNTSAETTKRAIDRILGTLSGAVLGALIAVTLFSHYPNSLYLNFIFLFLAFYFIRHRYSVGMCFSTIMVISTFYLFDLQGSVYTFILARLGDTALGIVICVIGELLFFFRSIIEDLRKILYQYYTALDALLFLMLTKNISEQEIANQWEQVNNLFQNIETKATLIKYEPLLYVSKRYWLIKKLYQNLHVFTERLKAFDITPESAQQCPTFTLLHQCIQALSQYRKGDDISLLTQSHQTLQLHINDLQQHNHQQASMLKLLQVLDKLLQLYQRLSHTHTLTPRWRR